VATERNAAMQSISRGSSSSLVEVMLQPRFYPHRPARVELKQTHMSWLFLAGEYVYKVKKPVHFDFADCSTLPVRYELCCEEVRLNRRLAPEVYLGVVPIVADGRRFLLGDESRGFDSVAREYAVKMRRLPEDRMLDKLVCADEVNGALTAELAKRLADFHRRASTAAGWRYGSATSVWRSVLGNLDECERFAGYTVTDHQFATIDDYLRGFAAAHYELLNDRVRQGYVRDGHGDLRCEHICMTNGIQIFDCLEFSERLRCVDVASDMAFLAMDLDSLGASRLGEELARAYAQEAGDETFPTLINFYKCHRACIRGKVESLKSSEDEVPSSERDQARDLARAHFSLASSYASLGRPALVVVCGLAGTGKSTVARMLQYRTGFEVLSSDRIRKRAAGVPEAFHGDTSYGTGIYSSSFDRLTYHTLLADAESHLRDGCGVIIDATFKRPEDRHAALATGFQLGIPVLFVECQADPGLVLRRLRERTRSGGGPSDATEKVYLRQRTEFVPINELSARQHLAGNTTEGVERVLPCIETSLSHLFEPSERVAANDSRNPLRLATGPSSRDQQ
jgi:uncharacterized protein